MSASVQSSSVHSWPVPDAAAVNNSSSGQSVPATGSTTEPAMVAGWLYKWTNYLKGYRKRWFVLQAGELSYYRNQVAAERGGASRGTISLRDNDVRVAPYERDSLVIVLNVSGASRVYVKAPNEAERARWFSALCTAQGDRQRGDEASNHHGVMKRGALLREPEADDDTLLCSTPGVDAQLTEAMASPQRDLDAKVAELQFCIQMLVKQQTALSRELATLGGPQPQAAESGGDEQVNTTLRALNERGTLMRVTATTALRACDELASLATQHGARYRRLVEHERSQRHGLETLIEQLARQHRSFEKQARKTLQRAVAAQQGASATAASDTPLHAAKSDARPATKKAGRGWLKRSSHNDSKTRQLTVECPPPIRPQSASARAISPLRQNTMPSLLVHSLSTQQLVAPPEPETKRLVGSATHAVFMHIGIDDDDVDTDPSDGVMHFVSHTLPSGGRLLMDDTKLLKADSAASTLSKSEQNLPAACSAAAAVSTASISPRATSASRRTRDRECDLVDFNRPAQFDDDSDDDDDDDDDDDFFDALDTSPAGSPSLTNKASTNMSSALLIEAHQRFQSQSTLVRSRLDSMRDGASAPSTPSKRADPHPSAALAAGASNSLLHHTAVSRPRNPSGSQPSLDAALPPASSSATPVSSYEQPLRSRAVTAPTESAAVAAAMAAAVATAVARPPTVGGRRVRRTAIAPKPAYSVSLWSILKNCVGKELSRIPMPVNFSEPISLLQRFAEDFEYSNCLDRAVQANDLYETMAYVAAFTVSQYSSTVNRTTKPFNPLLAETFEMDRSDEPQFGWRLIAEQVSHHPPAAALHCESPNWTCFEELTMTTKFRGKYIQIQPFGVSRCDLRMRDGSVHQYSWTRVTTTVHNIIVGRLWIDQHGEMEVRNHTLGIRCQLKYAPYSYFSRDVPRKVTGAVYDAHGALRYVLEGTWDEQLSGCAVFPDAADAPSEVSQAVRRNESHKSRPSSTIAAATAHSRLGERRVLWRRNPPPRDSERMYNFTQFAIELNEFEPDVAPTDSRRRPDQRLMENGQWEAANLEKIRLEEKQRAARKRREMTAQLRGQTDANALRRTSVDEPVVDAHGDADDGDGDVSDGPTRGTNSTYRPPRDPTYKPRWFELAHEPCSGSYIYISNHRYWSAKAAQDWAGCPDIF